MRFDCVEFDQLATSFESIIRNKPQDISGGSEAVEPASCLVGDTRANR